MRLLSISVKNYRVLRDVSVELAPGLTLIGAPNETGKSTLVEAAHRGLFLKAKAGGKLRDAMLSQGRAEHPEVRVSFVAGGRTWHVAKKFAGQSGQCTLTQEGGDTWRGEEAETRLAEVLGVAPVSGKVSATAMAEQWAHLWVWQGEAGADPTLKANEHKGALLSRLERADGAVATVMQSALDSSLVARFQQEHAALFRNSGEPRADSPLGRAEDEWSRAREALAAAAARCDALTRSAATCVAAREALDRASADQAAVGPQWLRTESALGRVAELRVIEARQVMAFETARLHHAGLEKVEAQIAECTLASRVLAEALAPEEAAAEAVAREEDECHSRLEAAEAVRVAAAAARAAAQQTHDLAAAWLAVREKAVEVDRCQERRQFIESLQADERRLALELAGLPGVDAAALKALSALEKSRDEAAATLRGMAAGLHVVAADQPVRLDGAELRAGDERVLTSPAEIVIGSGVRLRLTPGGGAGLAEASSRQAAAEQSLQSKLAAFGLPSVAAAAETHDRRRQLEADRTALRKRLVDHGAEQAPAQLASAIESLAAAEAALARLVAAVPAGGTPDDSAPDVASAQADCRRAAQELAAAQTREEAAASARTSADQALAHVRRRRTELASALSGRRKELERARVSREVLVAAHGEDTVRAIALAAAAAARTSADAALTATRAELTALQPEALEADRERLRRALDEIARRQREAETSLAIARNELTRDGGDDPHALLAQAAAREQAAAEAVSEARREAEAVRLLHRLFAEEQRELAARLTRPLADRINGYLQCVFGPGAEAVLAFEDQQFGSFALSRPGQLAGAVPFEALSGGAREQVAAAMRLAMAEVLAAGHDGCLPLVLDDAFAYADPDRVQALQRMLDLAARRGLQPIVLTCTPGDYAALGARVVALSAG
jgi:recombinational DNA repair ATPase RecF